MTGVFFLIGGAAVVFFDFLEKKKIADIEQKGNRYKARVTGYEKKLMRVGGSWMRLEYPLVEYVDLGNKMQSGFVKYAKSNGRYFEIGEEIEILVGEKYIYYKEAMHSPFGKRIGFILMIVGAAQLIYRFVSIR